jgi:hypothetical protein
VVLDGLVPHQILVTLVVVELITTLGLELVISQDLLI